jgi:hypothetical protein
MCQYFYTGCANIIINPFVCLGFACEYLNQSGLRHLVGQNVQMCISWLSSCLSTIIGPFLTSGSWLDRDDTHGVECWVLVLCCLQLLNLLLFASLFLSVESMSASNWTEQAAPLYVCLECVIHQAIWNGEFLICGLEVIDSFRGLCNSSTSVRHATLS